ncbi:MAG: membrane protein insertion efficiency factor YidD [Caldicoprobacterales bacterium]|jgi:putative membrane protein insertion efficiency factor|nr:membrane protein insertion efficiency factor YidD [Clostridiales bacterium]
MRKFIIDLIKLYQRFISPLFPNSCRFYPTCSHYTILALEKYGVMRGLWKAIRRISKCHPFHPGGYDPLV